MYCVQIILFFIIQVCYNCSSPDHAQKFTYGDVMRKTRLNILHCCVTILNYLLHHTFFLRHPVYDNSSDIKKIWSNWKVLHDHLYTILPCLVLRYWYSLRLHQVLRLSYNIKMQCGHWLRLMVWNLWGHAALLFVHTLYRQHNKIIV